MDLLTYLLTVIRTKSKNVINDNCVSNRDGLQTLAN